MRSIRGITLVLVITMLGGCIIRTRGRARTHSHSSGSTNSGPTVRDHRRNDPPPPPPPPPPTVRDHRR